MLHNSYVTFFVILGQMIFKQNELKNYVYVTLIHSYAFV